MASNTCWGIEVGSGALKAIKIVREGDNVTVADVAVIGHKKPLSAPEVDEKEARRVVLGQLISQHDLTRATIAVSVPGSQSFARFPPALPATEPKQVPALVEYEAKQHIPFPLEEVQWDYQTFAEENSPLISVGIFAIRTETVMDQLAKWQDVGRVPDIVTLNPLAVYNAIAWDQSLGTNAPNGGANAGGATVIIDIGTTSTDLIIADGPKLWVRTFPIGGHQFTEALVTAYNISYLKAEKLKSEAETSQAARQILQALRPVFGDLAQDVQRSLNYYTSQPQNREVKLARVLCHGSTFQLPGLKKFLSQQLQMDVSMIEGYSRVSKFASPEVEAKFKAHVHELAPALGLALQGVDLETINANLVPMSLVRENLWKDKTKWFAAAAGLALLAGGVMFVRPLLNNSAMAGNSRPAEIDDTRRLHTGLKGEWETVKGQYQPHPKAAATMSLLDGRELMPKLLDDVGTLLSVAAQQAAGLPGDTPGVVEFGEFTTTYLGAEAATAVDPATGQPMSTGGPANTRNSLTIRVSRESRVADRFIEERVLAWLRSNTARSGGVYWIKPETVKYQFVGTSVVDEFGNLSTPQGGSAPAAPRPRPVPGVGGGAGGRGNPVSDPEGAARGGGGPRGVPMPPIPPGMGIGAGSGGGGGGGGGQVGDAEKAAPVGRLSPFAPGSTVTSYVVTWEVTKTNPNPQGAGNQETKP